MTGKVSVREFVYLALCMALCVEASPVSTCPQHCECSQIGDSTSISAKCASLEAIHKFLHRPKQKMRFRFLDASNANITKIDMNMFEKLTHLEQLDLSSNKISVISKFPHLSNLRNLNLSSNEINFFSAVVFPTSIQALDLSNNKISELPINLKNLNDLEYFEVNENPLQCNCETVSVRDWLVRKKVVIKRNVLCRLSTGVYVSWLEVKSNTVCQQKSNSKQRKDFDIDYLGDDPMADIGSGNVEDDTVSEFKNVSPIIDEQGSGDPDDIDEFIPVIESKDHVTSAPESNTSNDFVFDEHPTSLPEVDNSEHTVDRPLENSYRDGSTTEENVNGNESSGDGEINVIPDTTSDDPDDVDDDYDSGNSRESPTSEKSMPVEYGYVSTTEDPYDDSYDDSEASGDFDVFEASGDDGSGAFLIPVVEEEIVAKSKQETLEQTPTKKYFEETQSSTSHAVIEPDNADEDEIIMSVDGEIETEEERHSTTASSHLSHEVHATREPSAEIIAGYTSAEGINEELGHVVDKSDSKQATAGTYVFLGILLAVLVCLLGFAIYRNQATKRLNRMRRYNKADVEKPATEMKEINKSLLIKEAEAMQSNGKPETLPLVKKEINPDTAIPRTNGFNNGRLPAADCPVLDNDEKADVTDSNMPEMQETPITPETERVKIKMSELPESVPKTPVLVTRTRSSAGDIIVTPNENQRLTLRNNIPK